MCQWQLRELRVNRKQGKESKSISVLMKVDMNNDKKIVKIVHTGTVDGNWLI